MSTAIASFVSAGEREVGCSCPHCGLAIGGGEPVAICRTCGTVHHGHCWEKQGWCGAYACAPTRIDVADGRPDALKISAEDIGQAVPLPSRRPVFGTAPAYQAPLPRTNRLAIAAFVTALAGIPFAGFPGLVAILLGSLAIGALRGTSQRGTILAISGIVLGIGDVIGWLFVFSTLYTQPALPMHLDDLQSDPAALEGLTPPLNRAMRATAILESNRKGLWGGTAFGSGVILHLDGRKALVVTNRHVVDPDFPGAAGPAPALDGLPPVGVRFLGQGTEQGAVVWLAPDGIDLALVRVEADTKEVRAAPWIPQRAVHVGDTVFAIGNPHRLGWTHTQGVVSQLRRQLSAGRTVRVIQTQTALNPGNSGGGLFDHEGFLVGINTWTNDKRVSEGLGFAISLDTLLELNPPALAGVVSVSEKP